MHVCLDAAERDAEGGGYLAVRHFAQVAECHGLALPAGQAFQRGGEGEAEGDSIRGVGVGAGVGGRHWKVTPETVEGQVGCDLQDPAVAIRQPLDARPVGVGPGHRLGRHILGGGGVAQRPTRQAKSSCEEIVKRLFERCAHSFETFGTGQWLTANSDSFPASSARVIAGWSITAWSRKRALVSERGLPWSA